MKKFLVLFSVLGYFLFAGHAQNPIIQTSYTPDPAPMVYKDRIYVYTGDDVPGLGFYSMTRWRTFSSQDMINWTDHGVPISIETFSWAVDRAWASQCIERGGKFYWYVCLQTLHNGMAIGVAVADMPTGPFKDALGKPLIANGSWSNIDPSPYIDDDGQAYLYWGNGSLFYVKLNQDMISYSGDIVEIPQTAEAFGGVRRPRNAPAGEPDSTIAPKDVYVEGPWLYKRKDNYYLLFAGFEKGGECLSYSMSKSPVGPWKYKGRIMVDQATNSFTHHAGVVDFHGQSYLFYHTGLLPGGGSYGRATAIERFSYNEDGTIPRISMTKEGVAPIGTLDPYNRTQAETIAWATKCKTEQDRLGNVYVTDTHVKSSIKVRRVDFGDTPPRTFSASLASAINGGFLEVYIDSIGGRKLATIELKATGGWDQWKTFTLDLLQPVQGVQDLVFYFNANNLTAIRRLSNFDWWQFNH
ncbi:glycoside hydrolase family 43 protein [Niabella terrae]